MNRSTKKSLEKREGGIFCPAILKRYVIAVLLLLLHAQGIFAQTEKKFNIQLNQVTLKDAFSTLEKQTGYAINYFNDEVSTTQKVTINLQQVTIREILNVLLKKTNYRYTISGNTIVITKPAPALLEEPGMFSGSIIDAETSEKLIGANVRVGTKGVVTGADGTFTLELPAGRYTATISYIGYTGKNITDVIIKPKQVFALDITLGRSKGNLKEVVVTASARSEGVASLYARQKNALSITDGISSEQIARTPDNNIGQVMKRVSGVATVDNKYVIVRGMTERYNQAMIDGIVVPSTDMNRRNFSFDVIPAELVSNVVVNKTATADVSSEFSGGQITVNTLDMPAENFTMISLGTGFNSNTLGKNFEQGGGRGKYDYLGFDDGRRRAPEGVSLWTFATGVKTPDYATAQSKLFRSEGLRLYDYKGQLNQNYRISLGRTTNLNDKLKFGFVAGINLRNTQEITDIRTARGTEIFSIDSAQSGHGQAYRFNTTAGALLNMGIAGKNFKLSWKNLYTRIFSDDLFDIYGYGKDLQNGMQRRIVIDPEATSLLQHKLEGEHTLTAKGLKLNWSGALTNVHQALQDRRKLTYGHVEMNGQTEYLSPNLTSNATTDTDPDYRLSTQMDERDYNWMLSLQQPFRFLRGQSSVKAGYTGWYKQRSLSSLQANTFTNTTSSGFSIMGTYDQILSPERVGTGQDQAYYYLSTDNGQQYAGSSKYHAAFLMLDQRFFTKLRLVYGVRLENFNLANDQAAYRRKNELDTNANHLPDPEITGEKNWRLLPSANVTYSLTDKMNLRLAYSMTMVRPDFRESSYFGIYDPTLEAGIFGWNVVSTKIYNSDFRYEWYPHAGEILSVSAFYKKFDKPLELVLWYNNRDYRFQNQQSAINYGFEMEFRKTIGGAGAAQWLKNLTLFGNGSLIWSQVDALDYTYKDDELVVKSIPGIKRPLYGQTPYTINAGINYNTPDYGINVTYNRTGRRPFTLHIDPNYIEYEQGRNLVDLQLYTRLIKKKMELKLNVSNLLNAATLYYLNINEYELEAGIPVKRVNGSDRYEKDKDVVRYRTQNGQTLNLSVSYRL